MCIFDEGKTILLYTLFTNDTLYIYFFYKKILSKIQLFFTVQCSLFQRKKQWTSNESFSKL